MIVINVLKGIILMRIQKFVLFFPNLITLSVNFDSLDI